MGPRRRVLTRLVLLALCPASQGQLEEWAQGRRLPELREGAPHVAGSQDVWFTHFFFSLINSSMTFFF